MSGPSIEFVNHASVLIRHGEIGLLSDPWYSGPAFHKGWRLMHETPDADVADVLTRTTHIWVSHEHPDHFSVPFFKRWGNIIRARGIQVLFQKIADQRVANFIRDQGFALTELPVGKTQYLGGMQITCLKDEFYDSALSVHAGGRHILNLNDCAVGDTARAREIRDAVGTCDILLTQFSYAAWKGGRENRSWREEAAREKLRNIRVQAEVLAPGMVIPFASFVRFAHARNEYLNDAANTVADVERAFQGEAFDLRIMKPGDVTDGQPDAEASAVARDWWLARDEVSPPMTYHTVSEARLRTAFDDWRGRVHAANNVTAMRIAQMVKPIGVLQHVTIHCDDTGDVWRVDPVAGTLTSATAPADLTMHSESLHFVFSNSFGFDTLTVNGTFEEASEGGFARAARSLAIENLNNLGLAFGPSLIFQKQLLSAFFDRMRKVRSRMLKSS